MPRRARLAGRSTSSSAEALRHPARDRVDQLGLYGELRERVIGAGEVGVVDPAAQRGAPLEQLLGVVVARAVDPGEDRQDANAAIDEPGQLRAVDRQRRHLALAAGPRGLVAPAQLGDGVLKPAL